MAQNETHADGLCEVFLISVEDNPLGTGKDVGKVSLVILVIVERTSKSSHEARAKRETQLRITTATNCDWFSLRY